MTAHFIWSTHRLSLITFIMYARLESLWGETMSKGMNGIAKLVLMIITLFKHFNLL